MFTFFLTFSGNSFIILVNKLTCAETEKNPWDLGLFLQDKPGAVGNWRSG